MKLFAVASVMAVLFCQLASGFMIAPSAFAGSSVVSELVPLQAASSAHVFRPHPAAEFPLSLNTATVFPSSLRPKVLVVCGVVDVWG